MKHNTRWYSIGLGILFAVSTAACAIFGVEASKEPNKTVAPLNVGADLSAVDLCQAIPVEDIEAVMGRKLVSAPEKFEYYDAPGSSGCVYDAGKDSSGNAVFGYVILTPAETYDQQPLYKNVEVTDLGAEAYFNNGADARQLWVKINPDAALVIAFGDVPNEAGAKAIARLVLAAVQTP